MMNSQLAYAGQRAVLECKAQPWQTLKRKIQLPYLSSQIRCKGEPGHYIAAQSKEGNFQGVCASNSPASPRVDLLEEQVRQSATPNSTHCTFNHGFASSQKSRTASFGFQPGTNEKGSMIT